MSETDFDGRNRGSCFSACIHEVRPDKCFIVADTRSGTDFLAVMCQNINEQMKGASALAI